jgi:hypothetical protein
MGVDWYYLLSVEDIHHDDMMYQKDNEEIPFVEPKQLEKLKKKYEKLVEKEVFPKLGELCHGSQYSIPDFYIKNFLLLSAEAPDYKLVLWHIYDDMFEISYVSAKGGKIVNPVTDIPSITLNGPFGVKIKAKHPPECVLSKKDITIYLEPSSEGFL